MKKMLVLAAILGITLVAFPISASEGYDTDESPYPRGLYVGIAGAYNALIGSDINDFWKSGAGPAARLGYNSGSLAIELEWMQSYHDAKLSSSDATITGYSINIRESFSKPVYPNRFYVLAGIGYYTIELDSGNAESHGWGFNLGVGYEHFITRFTALNIGLMYRFIEYNEAKANGVTTNIGPETGDMANVQAGLNVYF